MKFLKYKGIRIRMNMRNIYYQSLGMVLLALLLVPFYLCLSFISRPTLSFVISLVFFGSVIWLYSFYACKSGKSIFMNYKNMQKITRMVINSGYYISAFENKKKKITYFPKLYYKHNKKTNSITITIALDGSRFQKSFLQLGETLELMLACDLLESNISNGFIEYRFMSDVNKLRISVNDVIPIGYQIPLMKGLLWDIAKTPHMLIVGGTGGGKTYFIFTLIQGLLRMKADLILLDPKQSDLADLEKILPNVAYKQTGIEMQLRMFYEGMEKRYEEMRSLPNYIGGKDFTYYGLKPVVVIFDEFVAFVDTLNSKEKEKVNFYLNQVILKGRQAGYFIVLATQRPDAQYLSGAMRDQLNARVVLGKMSDDGYRMAYGNVDKKFVNKGQRGRGYIHLLGTTNGVREFISPFVPEDYCFMASIEALAGEALGAQALEAPSGNGSVGAKPANA